MSEAAGTVVYLIFAFVLLKKKLKKIAEVASFRTVNTNLCRLYAKEFL